MTKFPNINSATLLKRLELPQGKIRMVLDTDTYNEIDDQFAVIYAMLAKEKLTVEAIYAAPFYNELSTSPEDGMEKSYKEILRILKKIKKSSGNFVYKGSKDYLHDIKHPHRTDAALDLIERAMASPEDDPLYVVAIGAITNIASAILIEPKIIEKIVVVWLGGHALHWPNTKEFNLHQDILSSRIIFDCGVPLVHISCMGVTSHLLTTLTEVEQYLKGRSEIGDYLVETFKTCHDDHFAYSRVIWDISTIAYLVNSKATSSELVHSPILTDQFTWSYDSSRHFIRYVSYVNRDVIFKDLFSRINEVTLE